MNPIVDGTCFIMDPIQMKIQSIERKLEKAVPQKPPEQVIRPCCYYLRAIHCNSVAGETSTTVTYSSQNYSVVTSLLNRQKMHVVPSKELYVCY